MFRQVEKCNLEQSFFRARWGMKLVSWRSAIVSAPMRDMLRTARMREVIVVLSA
jgi:hypothetical protein